jgi:hypothetical protein
MGALDDVITRLRAAISRAPGAHTRARVALMREFLRRSALWSEALGVPAKWPLFDVAGEADPSAPQPEVPADLVARPLAPDVRATLPWMLRWAAHPPGSIAGLPDPYEPLLLFYERGGGFTIEQGMLDVDGTRLPIRDRGAYLRATPFTDLDPAALDALDAAARAPAAPAAPPNAWAGLLANPTRPDGIDEGAVARLREAAVTRPRGVISTYVIGADDVLAAVTALRGAEACRALVADVSPLLRNVGISLGPKPDASDYLPALHLLSFSAIAECAGAKVDVGPFKPKRWLDALPGVPELPEERKITVALLALGAGEPRIAEMLSRKPERFAPGRTVGADPVALVRYLAAAMQAKAGLDAVEPAWDAFVRGFPAASLAGKTEWRHLLLAARVVLAKIGGTPVDEVADALHRRILALAAEPAS